MSDDELDERDMNAAEGVARAVFRAERLVDQFMSEHIGNLRALLLEPDIDEAAVKLQRLRRHLKSFLPNERDR